MNWFIKQKWSVLLICLGFAGQKGHGGCTAKSQVHPDEPCTGTSPPAGIMLIQQPGRDTARYGAICVRQKISVGLGWKI